MNALTPESLAADVIDAVRETALLADVTLCLWAAERTDKKIMDQAKQQAGAVGNVGRAIKNLLAGADHDLKDARSAFGGVRAQHYALTLPWVSDPHAERQRGPRLLPNMMFDRYMGEMARKRTAAMAALDKFIDSYPACAVQAQANLAGLADADDYPAPDAVRAQFKVAFDFEPVPSGAGFRGLPPATLAKLETALRRKQEAMAQGAAGAMWDEVLERLGHLAARLSDPATRFKASTVEGVQELRGLLPGWDVGRDPRMAEVLADIDRMIGAVTPQVMRDNLEARAGVVAQAEALTSKLRGWGL